MKELLEEIRNSFNLLSYEKSWDDEGAEPMNMKAYFRALEFICRVVNEVGAIKTPAINLCRDGSLDIAFHNDKLSTILLINVTDKSISWYGDDGTDIVNHTQEEPFVNLQLFNFIKKNLQNITK